MKVSRAQSESSSTYNIRNYLVRESDYADGIRLLRETMDDTTPVPRVIVETLTTNLQKASNNVSESLLSILNEIYQLFPFHKIQPREEAWRPSINVRNYLTNMINLIEQIENPPSDDSQEMVDDNSFDLDSQLESGDYLSGLSPSQAHSNMSLFIQFCLTVWEQEAFHLPPLERFLARQTAGKGDGKEDRQDKENLKNLVEFLISEQITLIQKMKENFSLHVPLSDTINACQRLLECLFISFADDPNRLTFLHSAFTEYFIERSVPHQHLIINGFRNQTLKGYILEKLITKIYKKRTESSNKELRLVEGKIEFAFETPIYFINLFGNDLFASANYEKRAIAIFYFIQLWISLNCGPPYLLCSSGDATEKLNNIVKATSFKDPATLQLQQQIHSFLALIPYLPR